MPYRCGSSPSSAACCRRRVSPATWRCSRSAQLAPSTGRNTGSLPRRAQKAQLQIGRTYRPRIFDAMTGTARAAVAAERLEKRIGFVDRAARRERAGLSAGIVGRERIDGFEWSGVKIRAHNGQQQTAQQKGQLPTLRLVCGAAFHTFLPRHGRGFRPLASRVTPTFDRLRHLSAAACGMSRKSIRLGVENPRWKTTARGRVILIRKTRAAQKSARVSSHSEFSRAGSRSRQCCANSGFPHAVYNCT